jgi:hypothetical protein
MANRYQPIKLIKDPNPTKMDSKLYYSGTKYPIIPLSFNDTYVYGEEGDRFDTLALQYYGDPDLWWIISAANNSFKQNSYYVPLNVQIRIPSNVAAIVAAFNRLNNRNV